MKRAILAVSAAFLLLVSAPALADGHRAKHNGFGHDVRHGHQVKHDRAFKGHRFADRRHGYRHGHRHGHHFRQRHFGGPIYPPHIKRYLYGWGFYGHRPHFRGHAGRDRFRGHRHWNRY